jgi:hypothetical protein
MIEKKILFILLLFSTGLFSQDIDVEKTSQKKKMNKLSLGLGINIPFKPHSVSYTVGIGVEEKYEFLLWEHWSLIQGLSYNFISGKKVTEFYEGQNVEVQYEMFNIIPLQIGVGFYFGENHQTFFILLKGGIAWYNGVNPAYPEISYNGNVVKEAVPKSKFNGSYGFFTPSIGWQFKRSQISLTYQGHVEQNASINIMNISYAFNLL